MPRATRLSQSQHFTQPNYSEQNDEEKTKKLEVASSKLVSFIIQNLDNQKILRQTALQKYVSVPGVHWSKQLKAANIRLTEIYGCELVILDDPSVKTTSYYVKSLTPNICVSDDDSEDRRKKIVTFLIMTIVFMSSGKCSEKHLMELFHKLDVRDSDDKEDDNVKFILKELQNGQMISIDNDTVTWGPLAEVLVNKMEILEFVSKVYGTRIETWGELHENALTQVAMNKMDEEDDNMNGEEQENDEAGHSQRQHIK